MDRRRKRSEMISVRVSPRVKRRWHRLVAWAASDQRVRGELFSGGRIPPESTAGELIEALIDRQFAMMAAEANRSGQRLADLAPMMRVDCRSVLESSSVIQSPGPIVDSAQAILAWKAPSV